MKLSRAATMGLLHAATVVVAIAAGLAWGFTHGHADWQTVVFVVLGSVVGVGAMSLVFRIIDRPARAKKEKRR